MACALLVRHKVWVAQISLMVHVFSPCVGPVRRAIRVREAHERQALRALQHLQDPRDAELQLLLLVGVVPLHVRVHDAARRHDTPPLQRDLAVRRRSHHVRELRDVARRQAQRLVVVEHLQVVWVVIPRVRLQQHPVDLQDLMQLSEQLHARDSADLAAHDAQHLAKLEEPLRKERVCAVALLMLGHVLVAPNLLLKQVHNKLVDVLLQLVLVDRLIVPRKVLDRVPQLILERVHDAEQLLWARLLRQRFLREGLRQHGALRGARLQQQRVTLQRFVLSTQLQLHRLVVQPPHKHIPVFARQALRVIQQAGPQHRKLVPSLLRRVCARTPRAGQDHRANVDVGEAVRAHDAPEVVPAIQHVADAVHRERVVLHDLVHEERALKLVGKHGARTGDEDHRQLQQLALQAHDLRLAQQTQRAVLRAPPAVFERLPAERVQLTEVDPLVREQCTLQLRQLGNREVAAEISGGVGKEAVHCGVQHGSAPAGAVVQSVVHAEVEEGVLPRGLCGPDLRLVQQQGLQRHVRVLIVAAHEPALADCKNYFRYGHAVIGVTCFIS
eukprot:821748-Rhodomonas_salina.2